MHAASRRSSRGTRIPRGRAGFETGLRALFERLLGWTKSCARAQRARKHMARVEDRGSWLQIGHAMKSKMSLSSARATRQCGAASHRHDRRESDFADKRLAGVMPYFVETASIAHSACRVPASWMRRTMWLHRYLVAHACRPSAKRSRSRFGSLFRSLGLSGLPAPRSAQLDPGSCARLHGASGLCQQSPDPPPRRSGLRRETLC